MRLRPGCGCMNDNNSSLAHTWITSLLLIRGSSKDRYTLNQYGHASLVESTHEKAGGSVVVLGVCMCVCAGIKEIIYVRKPGEGIKHVTSVVSPKNAYACGCVCTSVCLRSKKH